MEGSILANACTLAMESRYQSINMGSENIEKMRRTGQGKRKEFSIYLTECSLEDGLSNSEPWHYLQVTFDGISNNGLFDISGSAGGIALQLTNKYGESAIPGRPMSYVRIDNKSIRLDYVLQLKTTHDHLRVGEYSSVIKYRVSYF